MDPQLLQNTELTPDITQVAIASLEGRLNQLEAFVHGGGMSADERYEKLKEATNHCPSPLQPDDALLKSRDSRNLKYLQESVGRWSKKNFGDQDAINPLLGVVEEVGELCHAILKMRQGIRGTQVEHRAATQDAIGDVMIYLADFCYRNELDLHECVFDAWDEVRKRDWQKNKFDGK